MSRKGVCVLAILLALVVAVAAQTEQTDEFIKAEMQRQNIPGLSLAVVKDGKIIKAQGYGFADIRRKVLVEPDTIFRIASVSKQFIATGIMLLVQEGQLQLDEPINRFLVGAPAAWQGITIRHLLTHTSGLVREAPGFNSRKVQSDADVIKSAYGVPLAFATGAKYLYSNLGYFILGEIIRKAAARPWTDYLHDKVFKPAGMNTTYPTNTRERIDKRASAYVDNDKLQQVDDDWAALRPSGAFLSTVWTWPSGTPCCIPTASSPKRAGNRCGHQVR